MKYVYINLDSRLDRRSLFEQECEKMNLQVERFPAVFWIPGGIGCCISHLDVLKRAKEEGVSELCVFEDDFEFLISKEQFQEVLRSLPEDYDVVMLGYNLQQGEEYSEKFGRTLEAQTTSGYIIHQRAYDKLIAVWSEGLRLYELNPEYHWLYILDQSWKPLQKELRWYHTLPRVGKQRSGWSDLSQSFVEYNT